MFVLVTGGTGRIGRLLVERLLKEGHKVRLLVHNAAKAKKIFPSLECMEIDLSKPDTDALAKACSCIEAVVHLAALVDYKANAIDMRRINVEGTKKLVYAAKAADVKRFVFVSSTGIYRGCRGIINEGTEPLPKNLYGESKLEAEQIIKDSGVPYVILRPTLVYGRGFDTGFNAVLKWVEKGLMPVIGRGKNRISLVHASDVINALILALNREEALYSDFIISSGEELTQKQVLNAVADALNAKKPRLLIPRRLAYFMLKHYNKLGGKKVFLEYAETLGEDRFYDCAKAKRVLGFKPSVAFEDGLQEIASEWLKKNQK